MSLILPFARFVFLAALAVAARAEAQCPPDNNCNWGFCSGTSCSCYPGASGPHCENSPCGPNPCQNGGFCDYPYYVNPYVNNGFYTCACAPGFMGVNCQTNINECAANPCQNGGVCTDGVNSYTCACPPGYSGVNCATPPPTTTTTPSTSTSSTTSTSTSTSSSTSTEEPTTSSTSSSTSSTEVPTTSSTSEPDPTTSSSTTVEPTTSSTSTTEAPTTTTSSTTPTSTTTSTLPPPLCGVVPEPSASCRLVTLALKGSIQLTNSADDTKDSAKWKWAVGAMTTLADFRDPVNGAAEYRFCLYDGSGRSQPLLASAILAGGTCGTKPCWKATGTKGFSMANKLALPDGITKIKLGAGLAGKAKVQLTAKGANVPMPSLPLVLPVTAQLLIHDSVGTTCFQTTYTVTTVNDGLKFKAKGP